jgi:hypothetical protein
MRRREFIAGISGVAGVAAQAQHPARPRIGFLATQFEIPSVRETGYVAQAEQNRRGAKDCFVRPLALGFYAEVVANFGKCHLDLPPADEPSENVAGASVEVGGEESLRLEFACRTRSQRIGLRRTRSSGS